MKSGQPGIGRRTILVPGAVLFILAAMGCTAFVDLQYPPTEDENGNTIVTPPSVKPPGEPRKIVLFAPQGSSVEGARRKLGQMDVDGLLFSAPDHKRDIVTQGDTRAWLREALKWELEKAGYSVMYGEDASPGSGVVVTSELETLAVNGHTGPFGVKVYGSVSFHARLMIDGKDALDFQCAGHSRVDRWTVSNALRSSVALALSNAASEFMAQLEAALSGR